MRRRSKSGSRLLPNTFPSEDTTKLRKTAINTLKVQNEHGTQNGTSDGITAGVKVNGTNGDAEKVYASPSSADVDQGKEVEQEVDEFVWVSRRLRRDPDERAKYDADGES